MSRWLYVRTALLVALALAGVAGEAAGWAWVLGGVDDVAWHGAQVAPTTVPPGRS